ncbi:hypothetical protein AAG570_012514 [Ranatra chinensis]|uniref:Uncharacterized protein n=1 Tax=Ranatra chinensis TaxID=642074 RepID=A0ABD0Z2B9_9HEMI
MGNISDLCPLIEEPYRSRSAVQCTRCQEYQHTKGYCNRPPRCVRCGGGHESSTCLKTRETPATCALCGGDHPANYKGCQVYKELQERSRPGQPRRDVSSGRARPVAAVPTPMHVADAPPKVHQPPQSASPATRIDVALLTETHFTNRSHFYIPDYVTYRTDHPDCTAHGGTAVLVRRQLSQYALPALSSNSLQSTAVSILFFPFSISFAAVYCPPNQNLTEVQLTSLFHSLGPRFISGGDYNCKHLLWGCRLATPRGRILHRVITSQNYSFISPDSNTYWPSHINRLPDILDFFVTSGIRSVYSTAHVLHDLSSDHSPVLLTTSLVPIEIPRPPTLTPGPTNWESFQETLNSQIDLLITLKTPKEVDEATQNFTEAVQKAACASSQQQNRLTTRHYNVPIHIRNLISAKRRARSKWQRSRYPSDRRHFEDLARELRNELSIFRAANYDTYVSSLSPKDQSLWTATKRLLNCHSIPSPLLRQDNSWDTTKVTLRNMSLVARHEASDSALREHKEENLKKGITYAKEAVALDPGDGNSWAILGNAYLTQFFNGETQDNTIIEKALQAYTQAERSEAANINPELHFNKGIALTFKEAFKDAINCFKKSLSVDPLFPFAKEKLNVTLKYLNRIKELIESKGKLKEKRIKNMLVDLEKGGSGIEDKTLKKVYILELTSGKNENKYLEGKVLWSTQIDDGFPFTFGLIDGKRTLAAVTMFNLAVGKGVLIGDTVAILNPLFDIMEFQLNEKVDYYIPKVRVNCPMSVVVNKKPVPTTWRSAAGITTIEAN